MRFVKHPATVIATVALFLAMGGGAAAYASGLINGSQIKNHSIAAKKLTKSAIKSLHGKAGPAGPAGATGATGAQGPQGPAGPGASWAAVKPDSTIARQSGGITIAHPQNGGYTLNFGSDVSRDLIIASLSLINDGGFRGTVLAASCVDYAAFCTGNGVPDATKQNWVAVFTTATDNTTQANHAFFVAAMGPVSLAPAPHASSSRMGALGR